MSASLRNRIEKLERRLEARRQARERISPLDRHTRLAQLYAAGHPTVVRLFDIARERCDAERDSIA